MTSFFRLAVSPCPETPANIQKALSTFPRFRERVFRCSFARLKLEPGTFRDLTCRIAISNDPAETQCVSGRVLPTAADTPANTTRTNAASTCLDAGDAP